jgi:CheY-like chemotaxis protein
LNRADRKEFAVRPHLLLVEDDDEQARFYQEDLENMGYRVTRVRSGAAALAAVKQRAFDLVLLDMDPGEENRPYDLGRCEDVLERYPVVMHYGSLESGRIRAWGAGVSALKSSGRTPIQAMVQKTWGLRPGRVATD